MSKRGRPRGDLPKASATITRRVRTLVDEAHGGNVNEAARATGLAYPTLRALYTGVTDNPALRTLEALAAPYGLELGWLTDAEAGEALPVRGLTGLLPPHPSVPQQRGGLRRVPIPFAAWPMYEVYRRIAAWLEAEAPSAGRPIVHEGTGDAFTFRLTSYLLQPLLAAERIGEPDVIPFDTADEQPVVPDGPVGDHWVRQLRGLGEAWAVILEDVLDRSS